MSTIHTIIDRPHETEKAVTRGAGVYTFVVRMDSTKQEIQKAVEKYYGLKVKAVRTIILAPKTRSAGKRTIAKRPMMKKAIVTLDGGATLDINTIKTAA